MSSFFSEKLAGQDVSDRHLFTTTHPYMIELGLGMFTTGTLYEWWNEVNSNGFRLNRMAINNTRDKATLEAPPNDMDALLGITSSTEFFWYGWKPNKDLQNAGVYKKQDLSEYGKWGGSAPWAFDGAVGVVTLPNIIDDGINDYNKPIIGGTLADDGITFEKTTGDLPAAPDGLTNPNFEKLAPVYDMVNLNRYMTALSDFYPRSLWDKGDLNIGGKDTREVFASHELLTEIKSSKLGPYIEWSGEITFYINEPGLDCADGITEWVPFKLYLYSNSNSTARNKAVTVKNLTYVAPKRTVTGRSFSTNVDGAYTPHDPDDTASQAAAELDLQYNTVTKKWEGGTPQLFAKLTTSIGYPVVPSVERLEKSDISSDLDSSDFEESKFIPASGTAMPIRPQNGNPLQWQPNYVDDEDVRCASSSFEKETVTVYNYNTRRRYERDEEVLLSRIDGQWHVFPMWPPIGDENVVTSDVGRWGEFTYMMTNSDYYFRTPKGRKFSPRDAELSFHKYYYNGDPLNGSTNYGQAGGYNVLQPFNTDNLTPITVENGYVQITSFDSLDSQLFGIRQKFGKKIGQRSDNLCSISTTSATINSAGNVLPPPNPGYNSRNAAHSSTFFGCFFPNGYAGTKEFLANRDYNVVGVGSGAIGNGYALEYYDTQGENSSFRPLDPGDAIESRNNCRNSTTVDPTGQLTEDNNSWARAHGGPSANLFAQYKTTGLITFPQMPADVMTNASPEGKFGSPLYPVHRFDGFYQADVTQVDVAQAFLSATWLSKETLTNGRTEYTRGDSAFDLQPISRNNLTFRPLKMEGFIQLGKNVNDNQALELVTNYDEDSGSHETRRGFCVEAHRTQLDNKRPLSSYVEDREFWPRAHVGLTDDWGIKWGGSLGYKPGYNNLHEFSYWDRSNGAMQWTASYPGNWKGAGGFGVITTYNTVSANTQIDFTTDNIYGMGAAAHGRFTINGGHDNQDRTWGVSNFIDPYRQENIIDLSVRLFHQHPRNQTLFDPRTFAVHHFNPDVRYANDEYIDDAGTPQTMDPYRNLVKTEVGGKNGDGDPILFFYNYPVPISEVDLRLMSRYEKHVDPAYTPGPFHSAGKIYNSQVLSTSDYILRNATYNKDLPIEDRILPPVITNEQTWQIDTNRVGKLLPYRYYRGEIGVPCPSGSTFELGDDTFSVFSSSLSNTPALSLLDQMVVLKVGDGFAIGDTVGDAANAIQFKVTGTGMDGSIAELECTNPGTGIRAGQTAATGEVFNPTSENTGLSLRTLDSLQGGSFEAYYVSALPWNMLDVDPKPILMLRDGEEIVRIAADVPQGTHQTFGFTSAAEGGAFVNESREVTYNLDPSLYAENKQYDVFFHFHNDISMTWLASNQDFHGDRNNVSEASEQHISVRINSR